MTISPSEVSMGFNSENAHISPIVVDIETWPLENAADYLEPVQAARNLKDPEKIKADIEQKTAERQDKLALDCNVGRIAAIGWWTEESGINADVCKCEGDEATMLAAFWLQSKRRDIIGFNIKGFDLRYLIQRSRYLGISYPQLDMGKYSRKGVIDLYLELTFYDGIHDKGEMSRSLKSFCRRFGIPVDDTINGKDIPALVAAGEWDKVIAHVTSDVNATVALARKLGVVSPAREEMVL
jgi:predicted PolB exonuclease-like 3'-5' exonuclease